SDRTPVAPSASGGSPSTVSALRPESAGGLNRIDDRNVDRAGGAIELGQRAHDTYDRGLALLTGRVVQTRDGHSQTARPAGHTHAARARSIGTEAVGEHRFRPARVRDQLGPSGR